MFCVDSPAVPPSATCHQLFRGFSFVDPSLVEVSKVLHDCLTTTAIATTTTTTTAFIASREILHFMIVYGKEKMRLPKKLMNEVIMKHFVSGKFLLTY